MWVLDAPKLAPDLDHHLGRRGSNRRDREAAEPVDHHGADQAPDENLRHGDVHDPEGLPRELAELVEEGAEEEEAGQRGRADGVALFGRVGLVWFGLVV